jgi:hypothetical protein
MNAASQKTGIDIINPIIFKLIGIFLIPSDDIKVLTIFLDVPVSFNYFPRSDPVIIFGPIKITLFKNTLKIMYRVSVIPIFKRIPDKKDASSNVKNGRILNL